MKNQLAKTLILVGILILLIAAVIYLSNATYPNEYMDDEEDDDIEYSQYFDNSVEIIEDIDGADTLELEDENTNETEETEEIDSDEEAEGSN